jgi:hypothetical protein
MRNKEIILPDQLSVSQQGVRNTDHASKAYPGSEVQDSWYIRQVKTDHPVSFTLDLQLDKTDIFCSISKMITDKISSLRKDILIESLYLKLFSFSPSGEEKTAQITLLYAGEYITAESTSRRWDNAFLNAFDKIRRNIFS